MERNAAAERFPARRYLGRTMLVLAGLGFASGFPSAYKALGSTLQASSGVRSSNWQLAGRAARTFST